MTIFSIFLHLLLGLKYEKWDHQRHTLLLLLSRILFIIWNLNYTLISPAFCTSSDRIFVETFLQSLLTSESDNNSTLYLQTIFLIFFILNVSWFCSLATNLMLPTLCNRFLTVLFLLRCTRCPKTPLPPWFLERFLPEFLFVISNGRGDGGQSTGELDRFLFRWKRSPFYEGGTMI